MLPKAARLFHVDVENQPRRSFDTAAAAIAHGTRQVYLRFTEAPRMIERLERGESVAWSYGFASVEIAVRGQNTGPRGVSVEENERR